MELLSLELIVEIFNYLTDWSTIKQLLLINNYYYNLFPGCIRTIKSDYEVFTTVNKITKFHNIVTINNIIIKITTISELYQFQQLPFLTIFNLSLPRQLLINNPTCLNELLFTKLSIKLLGLQVDDDISVYENGNLCTNCQLVPFYFSELSVNKLYLYSNLYQSSMGKSTCSIKYIVNNFNYHEIITYSEIPICISNKLAFITDQNSISTYTQLNKILLKYSFDSLKVYFKEIIDNLDFIISSPNFNYIDAEIINNDIDYFISIIIELHCSNLTLSDKFYSYRPSLVVIS